MTEHWLAPTLSAMADILKLKENWDSYHAPPIDPLRVMQVLEFLVAVMRDDTPTPSVVPTSSGGVQIEWSVNGINLEIEFVREGKIGYLYENPPTYDGGFRKDAISLKNLVDALCEGV